MVVGPGTTHDGGVNDTYPTTDADTGHQSGPQPGPEHQRSHQDLDRLRRSTADRYVAGVAGGLGRHFGIDPTIVRVLLVVLTFFGGAGVLIYAACWLLVPEDGQDRAPIHLGSEPRKLLLVAAAGIAFLLAMGDAFSGFNAGWPITVAAVIVAAILVARDRKAGRTESRAAQAAYWAAARGEQPTGEPAPGTGTNESVPVPTEPTIPLAAAPFGQQILDAPPAPPVPPAPPAPPAWSPPRPPAVPPRPKRTGIIWFWPTLAMIAIGLGVLGIIDAGSADVVAAAYPALALGITGVMLLIGSVRGRPGGLILLGFVSAFSLAVATIVGGFNFSGQNRIERPGSTAEVASSYEISNGRIELDLTEVTDPLNLENREIDLTAQAGEILVIVPRGLHLHIEADTEFAGGIRIPGYDGGGIQTSVSRSVVPVVPTDGHVPNTELRLDLEVTVGQITVEQR